MKDWTNFKKDNIQYSPTEEFGLSFIKDTHKKILSVGISTAGFAELRMVLDNSERKVIATTLDENGLDFTKDLLNKYGVEDKVELKIEDIASDLDYEDNSFDFVYARLVLHYLPKEKLRKSLKSLFRVLNKDGELFVVVRSYDWESEVPGAIYDIETGLTTYPTFDRENNHKKNATRHLHSVGSITAFLLEAGFVVNQIKLFSETIYGGYERADEKINKLPANLIALHVGK